MSEFDLPELEALLEMSGDGLCLVEAADGRIIFANGSLLSWVGIAKLPTAGATIFQWFPEIASGYARVQLQQLSAGANEEVALASHRAGDANGAPRSRIRVRRAGSQGRRLLALAVERRDQQLAARSGTDSLTGLADRASLLERLSTLVHGDRRGDQRCAVLFVDVDGFKQVNDAHGHLLGDQVLREVAQRLVGCFRAADFVARFGGDEFVVLLERISGPREIEPMLRRIEAAFERPFLLPKGEVMLSVSVGASDVRDDGGSAEELIDAADRAMYAAKRAPA